MKLMIALIVCCMFLSSGCVGPFKQIRDARRARAANSCVWAGTGYKYFSYKVEYISDPPGAKIEVDNDYIGSTPITMVYNGITGRLVRNVIKAYPVSDGQYVQTKVLYGNKPMPRKIYFNMNIKPAPQEYDIKISN